MRIAGKTALERVVERVRRAEQIQQIIVATSDLEQDDVIEAECDALGVDWYRGPELDVLARYLEAAEHFDADPIVRVTADCPLIDPGVLNALVRAYHDNPGVMVTNSLERTFPCGLDAQVFSLAMLRQAAQQPPEEYDAEHVVRWMLKQPGAINLTAPVDLHHVRITLDTKEDLRVLRDIFHSFKDKDFITTADVLWLFERRPDLSRLAS
jgi:spore coat polysaccharide biosynthesis protein SpsF